ncbi:MAG: hypothetical protein H0W61_16335 [Bacteroidetes bacterium]|nr:hypothetical protein [Bacteroidota bacterium]
MIKYLFILINSLSLFLYSLFSNDGGTTITNNFPSSIKPGQTINVEIKIAKGSMSGFAKMQLDLPPGISVNEIDNKGATFSYVEGIAKWLWASLPAENEIVLKLSLIADPFAPQGKTVIGGKYSYVENSDKKVIEMAPVDITIGEAGAVSDNNTNTSTTPTVSTQNTNVTATSSETPTNTGGKATNNQNSNREPDGNITVQRTIIKGGGEGEYTINLKVNKGATKGFARYSDDLPASLGARAGKTEGASFSVADGKIKFVWVAVPEKEILELSYTIIGVSAPVVLHGEYSFLEQNQSKKYELPAETISPEAHSTANTETTIPTNTTSAVAVTENSTNTNTTSNSGNAANNSTQTASTQTTETSARKDGNISYHVQIGAFTNSAVSANRLKRKFSISEKIQSEFQGGFSKFMVGSHGEYKAARDHREKIKATNHVASAFVVAYNTGKRITVQEALMISNQKWFK